MGLKDSLNGKSVTVTLEPQDIAVLTYMNTLCQQELDMLQQRMAARFLNYVSVTKFGFEENSDLRFNLDPKKSEDNLTITEIREP